MIISHSNTLTPQLCRTGTSVEAYMALDDVVYVMKEVCDPLPAYAEPTPSSRKATENSDEAFDIWHNP